MSPSKPALAVIALGALNALFGSRALAAPDPSLDISQYAHTAWTFRNGFLSGAVYTIAQSADGYLWLGTQTGIYRFDGVRAVQLKLPQLASTEVGALLPARDGTLWIGTLDGLVSWKSGQLTEYPTLGRRRVNAILEDRDGTVWAGTALGGAGRLCAIHSNSTQCYGDDGSFGAAVQSLYEDSEGSLWVGARTGLWRWKPTPPLRYLTTPIRERQTLAPGDHQSGLLVAVEGGMIRQLTGTSVTDYPLSGVPSPLAATRLLRDRDGGLWIGASDHGLVHVYGGKTSTFTHKDGLSSDQVKALFQDREGTVWVGTSAGLDQFHVLAVTSLSVAEGLSSAQAYSVLAARDGSVWIGTADGLYRWKDGSVASYRKQSHPDMLGDEIDSLFEDESGRIWVSAFQGLEAFSSARFTAVPSVSVGSTFAIVGDYHGGLWLSRWFTSDDSGLVHVVDGKVTERVPGQKLGGPGTGGLVPDPDGGVWAGLFSGGLVSFRQGQIRTLPLKNDRGAASRVLDLSRNRDGTIWAATENGLSRISNGHVATLTTANGLPCNKVHWIIEGDSSSYWLYAQCGLLRVARIELDAWVADPKRTIQVTTFDTADGIRLVPTLSGFHPQVAKSSDGKIWFVNYDTVSFFDPSGMTKNVLAPPVHIEQITADHKAYDARSGLRLPPLVRDLSIDYTALSFVAPEKVHFKYKLEGQDPDWRQVVNVREAQYSNLSAGHYRFRVIASNNSGVWNETGASLDFSIAPAYWQTAWFRALCVAAILASLWMLYRLRMRQLAHEFDVKLEARVDERTRIARELHDTLLQSFQGLLLRFQTVRELLRARPAEAEEILESAIDQTAQAITEGRNAVQGLRTSTVERNDLAKAIKTFGEELVTQATDAKPAGLLIDVEGTARNLHPIVRDEIYRIASEALRNAFRHAEAKQIEVELRYDEHQLRLRVRDDGKGVDPNFLTAEGRAGHFGLHGMHERAKLIGGKLTVWSAPDSGTEIELSIPATRAYTESLRAGRAWFGEKRTEKSTQSDP